MPNDLEILKGRVERLERENLCFRRIGITVLILIGAALAMGQARPEKTLEAERFLLKDPDGNVRAKLDSQDGATKFLFLDRAGHERVAITSGENFVALEMKDEQGRLGATMGAGVSKDGMSSTIAAGAPLMGPVAGPGVIMQAWEVGTSLRICNKGGHQVWEAPSGREETRK